MAVGMYGDTFHAEGAGRRDLHALVVDASIAAEPGVASLLLDEVVPALRALEHRAVVGTIGAARDQGDLIVVTEPLPEHVTLHEVLTAARGSSARLPQEIAAAIARAVIDAVATAHAAGLVHGAIHPRSVLIDAKGDVSLADFAIGRTVTTAVARGASPDLTRPLVGYLAPDLAIGDEPSPASDVFALGALVFAMITGELPPGTLDTTPAVERLVQRALDTDLARRFGSAIELQENFAEALEDDRWYTATPAELARFVARHRAGGDAVDAATEDLLASLAATSDPPTRGTLDAAAVQDLLVGPSTGVTAVGSDTGSLDAVIESLAPHAEDDGDEPLTQVDGATAALQGERDPISEMIEIERARTGEEPVPEVEPPRHRSGERAR
ncbi:MAG: protein kinase, partial [Myxococcales bacterium]|nr:protein kinase [Myxococcales bacterium]